MGFYLEKIPELSGKKCTIYSPVVENSSQTLYDDFIDENDFTHPNEIDEIFATLETIGEIGAIPTFFKPNEGNLGDGVCALYDIKRKFRLYCIRYGTEIVILGGGALKKVAKTQQSAELSKRVNQMKDISSVITKKLKEHSNEIFWDGNHFSGTLVK